MGLGKRVLAGVVWNQAAKILEFVAVFLLSIVLARGLGTHGYGIYATLRSVWSVIFLLSALGFNQALNTFLPQFQTRNEPGRMAFVLRKTLLWRFLLTAALTGFLCFGAPFIGQMLHQRELTFYLRFSAVYLIVCSASDLLAYALYGTFKVREVALIKAGTIWFNLTLTYFLLRRGYGIEAVLFSLTLAWAGALLLLGWQTRFLWCTPREPLDLKPLYRFALAAWGTNIVGHLLGKQADILLMGYFNLPPSKIGYYNLAFTLNLALNTLLLAGLRETSLLGLSALHAQHGKRGLRQGWDLMVKLTVLVSLPMYLFVILFAPRLIPWFYGPDYLPAVGLVQSFFLFSLFARFWGGGANLTALYSLNQARVSLTIRFLTGGLNLLWDCILIPLYGAMGAVIATGGSNVCAIFLERTAFLRLLPTARFPWSCLGKLFLAGLGAGGVIYSLGRHAVGFPWLEGIGFILLYLLFLYLLKPFTPQDGEVMARGNAQLGKWLRIFAKGTEP